MDAPRQAVLGRRRPCDLCAALTTFVATMLALQGLIGQWSGPPRSAALEAKWADFERQADDCNVVFIGTSHVERHIDPRVVDDALAAQGMRARSYNLGLSKMSMLEGAEFVGRLVRRRPRRLKLVVLEPTLYLYDTDNWATDRAMAEHDWRGTWLAANLTWASETRRQSNLWGKLKCVAPHWLSFVCRALSLRCGERLFCVPAKSLHAHRCDAAAGFVPLPPADSTTDDLGWRERFQRFLQIKADWTGAPLSTPELAYFKDLAKRVRQMGATPVFLLGPKVKRDSHTAAVYTSHLAGSFDVALLDHLRGHGDAQIYQLRYWHDFDHLNADGAALYSRRLAAQIAPLLRFPDELLAEGERR